MKIELIDYKEAWKSQFLKMKKKLLENIKEVEIEHIGSTAVIGLKAKPIIDILIGIKETMLLNDTIKPLQKVGFKYISKYEKELPNRRFFIFEINKKRIHHIHLVKKNTNWFKRHVAFRNELRNNKDTMLKYQELKLQLSQKNWKSGDDYSNAKTSFIRNIENRILNGN